MNFKESFSAGTIHKSIQKKIKFSNKEFKQKFSLTKKTLYTKTFYKSIFK